ATADRRDKSRFIARPRQHAAGFCHVLGVLGNFAVSVDLDRGPSRRDPVVLAADARRLAVVGDVANRGPFRRAVRAPVVPRHQGEPAEAYLRRASAVGHALSRFALVDRTSLSPFGALYLLVA